MTPGFIRWVTYQRSDSSTTMRRANLQVRTIWQGPAVPLCDDKLCLYNRVTCPAGLCGVLCLPQARRKTNSMETHQNSSLDSHIFSYSCWLNITQSSKNFCTRLSFFLAISCLDFWPSGFSKNKFWNLIFISLTVYLVLALLFSFGLSSLAASEVTGKW